MLVTVCVPVLCCWTRELRCAFCLHGAFHFDVSLFSRMAHWGAGAAGFLLVCADGCGLHVTFWSRCWHAWQLPQPRHAEWYLFGGAVLGPTGLGHPAPATGCFPQAWHCTSTFAFLLGHS